MKTFWCGCLHQHTFIALYFLDRNEKLLKIFAYPSNNRAFYGPKLNLWNLLLRLFASHLPTFFVMNYSFSTYAKCSEELTFLTPWYTYVRVRIKSKKCYFFGTFCAHFTWMIPNVIFKGCEYSVHALTPGSFLRSD